MKKYTVTVLFVLTILSNYSFGQTNMPIQNVVEDLRMLLENPDKGKLERIAHEKLTYGHSSGKVENKAEFVEAFISGKTDFVNLKFSDMSINQVGNTAIVRHILEADSKDLGKEPGHVKIKVLLVFVKENKAWKLLTRQAVKI